MQDDTIFYKVRKPKRFEICLFLLLVISFLMAGLYFHSNSSAHVNNIGKQQTLSTSTK